MLEFCCKKFQFYYTGEKTMGLNIRIAKLDKEFIKRSNLDFDKSYFITEGYTGSIDECKKKIVINFCPFCGKELKRIYYKDEYVQEIITV
jgi:hypothetical protein